MGLNFLRRDSARYSKLGHKRKKKQKWKRPTGRDNKMREKRKGYPKVVSIGYKKSKKLRKNIVVIKNIKDLEEVKKNNIVIVGNVGKKKKIEIAKKAKEMKVGLTNLNVEKFLKKIEEKKAEKKEVSDKSKKTSKIEPKIKEDKKLTDKKISASGSEQVNGDKE